MSLIFCPECGHEVSANAASCPNCAHPMVPVADIPVVEKNVVVAPPPVVRRESGFPTWAIVPTVLLGIILLFVMYLALRTPDEQANVNVNVNTARRSVTPAPAATSVTETRTVTVPSGSAPDVVQSGPPPAASSDVPAAAPPAAETRGNVVLNASVLPPRGSRRVVKSQKLQLLDRDPETILDAARIEPIEGNSLTASLGLSIIYPDRYSDFYRAAIRAINAHVKYSGTTNDGGDAKIAGITPGEYYVFGIARVGQGFALWNSPVSVVAGQNVLNLSPQPVTEIPE